MFLSNFYSFSYVCKIYFVAFVRFTLTCTRRLRHKYGLSFKSFWRIAPQSTTSLILPTRSSMINTATWSVTAVATVISFKVER